MSSARYYQLIAGALGLLPLGRYAAATWLMGRAAAAQTAPLRAHRGRWVIVPGSPSSWAPAFGLKEPALQQHLLACLRRADAFLDCGANLGWYSFLASRQPGVRQIVAVEPVARSAHYIALIAQINRIERLRVLRGCVAAADGPTGFVFTPGAFSEHGHVAPAGADTPAVPGYRLETLLAGLGRGLRRACLKLDVEGYERAALASANPATLHERVAAALVEVHLASFANPAGELRAICALLEPVGELSFLLTAPELTPGFRRLWRRLSGRYPASRLPIEDVAALAVERGLSELFVVARRAE